MHHVARLAWRYLLVVLLLPCLAHAAGPLDQSPFTDLNGHASNVMALRGKMTLVNFWASWCSPCRQEMPMLDKLRQQWQTHGIEVLGIALDDKAAVQAFIRQSKIRYPIWLGDDRTLDQMPALGNPAMALPFTLLLDRQGRVVARWSGQLSATMLKQALAPYL